MENNHTMDVMTSSKSNEWETPDSLFKTLHSFFDFTLDVASTDANCKVLKHYTIETDGLNQSWNGERCFMNPPYGRDIGKWVKKAAFECVGNNNTTLVVCLTPARTDTKWFHDYIVKSEAVVFVKGRLKFINRERNETYPAPFPSLISIFSGQGNNVDRIYNFVTSCKFHLTSYVSTL